MNSIDEIKEILDKLNEELENLRTENQELKHRLQMYETVENVSKPNCRRTIDDIFHPDRNPELFLKNDKLKPMFVRAYNILIRNFSGVDIHKLTWAKLCSAHSAGVKVVALIIIVFEHYGIILEKGYLRTAFKSLDSMVDEMRKTISF